MIDIIPAIDVIEGKCVRLTQGEFSTKKTYSNDPLDMALRFEDAELKRLHLVDLDGARQGRVINYKVLEKISNRTKLKIDFGGGVRSDKDMQIAFECGAEQVNVGSIAVEQRELMLAWLSKHGAEKIILGADVRNEKVSVSGWTSDKEIFLIDYLHGYKEHGIKYVVCTDISKDGALQGPAHELYRKVLGEVEGIKLIASGGVTTLEDVEKLEEAGLHGVIIGKAIYEGTIELGKLKRFLC
ncbi:MAG: 1-(5-phosphoribosyl)-5-[(5-phosphoribosylamino)methylideneamino]imidazole-4-carboxamide isomerase [Deltaproteobacteria bacterium]|nr:1-(5-phosphoribosyl)-5-[(5-phosphoribosylamino)methylideneamino]imidazole-4-carboxamide isomerase [Deltaproteobacteria bacterium]